MAIKKFFQNIVRKTENETPDFEHVPPPLYGPPPGRSDLKKIDIFQFFKKRAAEEDPADNIMQTVYGPPRISDKSNNSFRAEENIMEDLYGPPRFFGQHQPTSFVCANCGYKWNDTAKEPNQVQQCPNCGLVQTKRK